MKAYLVLLLFFTTFQSCDDDDSTSNQNDVNAMAQVESGFKIKNATSFTLYNISVLSVAVDDLLPNSASKLYELNFVELEDDPIMSLKISDEKFIHYLNPSDFNKTVKTIVIDSLTTNLSFNSETLHYHLE